MMYCNLEDEINFFLLKFGFSHGIYHRNRKANYLSLSCLCLVTNLKFHICVVSPTPEKTEEDRPPVCPQLDEFSVRGKKKKPDGFVFYREADLGLESGNERAESLFTP